MPEKKKIGRPKKADAVRQLLHVRVSDDLYARLVEYGKTEGYSPAQVLRAWALLAELIFEDPTVLAGFAKDPLARRTQLVRLVERAAKSQPLLPMEGVDG